MQTFYSQAITVPVNFAIHNFSVNSKINTAAKAPSNYNSRITIPATI